ncbi:hypothetical protein ACW9UR_10160 [Halovulum sp. GXIMD14794]
MDRNTILLIIGAIWLIGMVLFLKDYLLGERKVDRKRGTPTLEPRTRLRRD